MKKFLAIILTAAFTFAGLWLALIAEVDDTNPMGQGGLAILAAITFCIALLCAGWGNSLKWKANEK